MSTSLSSSPSMRPRLLPQSPRTMASGGNSTPRSPSSPSSPSPRRRPLLKAALAVADAASWYVTLLLLALFVLSTLREGGAGRGSPSSDESGYTHVVAGGRLPTGAAGKPCDEIYVVGEGETLHTISDKCKDPFIVERNPHIHDPDDVFPGLVIRIVPAAQAQ